jgi:hypothetical protein
MGYPSQRKVRLRLLHRCSVDSTCIATGEIWAPDTLVAPFVRRADVAMSRLLFSSGIGLKAVLLRFGHHQPLPI